MLFELMRKKVVDPEAVAASRCRFKRPVPVCCGFESMVLQYGAAPSSAAYQATALLLSYRRGNGRSPRYCPVFANLKGWCFTIKACDPLKLASADGFAPTHTRLRIWPRTGWRLRTSGTPPETRTP